MEDFVEGWRDRESRLGQFVLIVNQDRRYYYGRCDIDIMVTTWYVINNDDLSTISLPKLHS